MQELLLVFIDIIAPVFALVLVGYFIGPRLKLEARTLSRTAFYILMPCFVFSNLAYTDIQVDGIIRMLLFSLMVCVCCAFMGYTLARFLRRPTPAIAGFILVAVFNNVGNFGLSIINFKWGTAGQTSATLFLLTFMIASFLIGLPVASMLKGNGVGSVLDIFKMPVLLALAPVMFIQFTGFQIPVFLDRISGLLSEAAIPIALLTLGVQLSKVGRLHITRDVFLASAIRILGGPIAAFILAALFGLQGLERNTAIMQASMPVAVMASIIAIEYDLEPEFVTTSVLFSTIASLVTLTLLLSIL
ncbi:MAG: AEC family transporter [Anaerolineales bacterium]|nr:AEC family transporter [Anaerolineales bacterium]